MNGLTPHTLTDQSLTATTPDRVLPDYRGGIVNLMSSLLLGLGGEANGYAPLPALPVDAIRDCRKVALIIVDGLGDSFLSGRASASFLAGARRGRLTSVFPSTTASAVTSFLTGVAPQQHGLTGWHMYFRELGAVLAVLPGRPRFGGSTLQQAGVNVGAFHGHRNVFERLGVSSAVISPAEIAHSDFNRAHLGPATLSAYRSMDHFFNCLTEALTPPNGPRFVYAYWPELDRVAHEFGARSEAAERHFLDWEQAFGRFLERIAGTDALIIVTADHGFIDTAPEQIIDLEHHPELADCLALPLCGEPRVGYCYLRPGCAERFEAYLREHLSAAIDCFRSDDLIRAGWFGLGDAHPRLHERVGDYTLIMKDRWVIRDRIFGEKPFRQRGVHGGLSSEEMWVPLLTFRT